MSTKFLSPGWRMPRNANQSKQSNYSMYIDGGSTLGHIDTNYYLPEGTKPKSISYWFKNVNPNGWAASGDYIYTVAGGQVSTGKAFGMGITSNSLGSYIWFIGHSFGDYLIPTSKTGTMTTNVWYHIVVTYDVTRTNNLHFYLDGVKIDETSRSLNTGTTSTVKIGARMDGLGGQGAQYTYVDQACFFDYALTDNQVTTLYGTGSAIGNPMALPSPPIAYYPLGTSAWNGNFLAENNAIEDYVFDFNGSSDRVYGPTGVFSGQTATTISFWVNADALSGVQNLFANGGYPYFRLNGTNIETTWPVSGNNFKNFASGMTAGKWHLFVFKWESGSKYQIYIDNDLKGESTSTITGSFSSSNTGSLEIGNATSNQDLQGKISNFKTWDVALTTSELTTLYNYGSPIQTLANIPKNSNLKAWYKLDASEVYNSSTTEWSIDNNQNPSAYPSSLDFDGVDETILLANSPIVTGVFTISMWIKRTSLTSPESAGAQYLIQKDAIGGGRVYSASFNTASGEIDFYVWTSAGAARQVTTSTVINDTEWHNVVFVNNGDTINNQVYLDGAEASYTVQNLGVSTLNSLNIELRLGGSSFYAPANFYGSMSNTSIWNTALTSAQVTEIYNNGTPSNLSSHSVTSNLVSWYKLNNTTTGIEDSKGSNNGTNNGATEYPGFVNTLVGDSSGMSQTNLVQSDLQTAAPYSKYAMNFDGTDYIDCGTNPFDQTTGDITLSAWVKKTSGTGYQPIISATQGIGSSSTYFSLQFNGTNSLSLFWDGVAGGDLYIIPSSEFTVVNGNWYLINFVRTGTVGTFYVNGNLVSTSTKTYNNFTYNDRPNVLLGGWNFSSLSLNGELSNASMWNAALTSAQIREIYNEGLPSDLNSHSAYSNLVSWWQLGENSSYVGGATNPWTFADEKGTNNGLSPNLPETALTNGVGTTANGVSTGMSEGNLVGDAPYSTANAISSGMSLVSRVSGSGNTP